MGPPNSSSGASICPRHPFIEVEIDSLQKKFVELDKKQDEQSKIINDLAENNGKLMTVAIEAKDFSEKAAKGTKAASEAAEKAAQSADGARYAAEKAADKASMLLQAFHEGRMSSHADHDAIMTKTKAEDLLPALDDDEPDTDIMSTPELRSAKRRRDEKIEDLVMKLNESVERLKGAEEARTAAEKARAEEREERRKAEEASRRRLITAIVATLTAAATLATTLAQLLPKLAAM